VKKLIEFPVEGKDSGVLIVEVDDPYGDAGVERAARRGKVTGRAAQSVTEVIDEVLPGTNIVLNKLRHLASAPDNVTLTFGIKLSGSVGAFIASAQGEGNFQVQMSWTRADAPNNSGQRATSTL
jgi:hypothetical protein